MSSQQKTKFPIITVDGPVGSGKGSISVMLAKKLGFHLLDSGALYRVLALAASNQKIAFDNLEAISDLAHQIDIKFVEHKQGEPAAILLDNLDVSDQIRTEKCGELASRISSFQEVRTALMSLQRSFELPPGLVADGRDMGTIVFPKANIKFFLTASQKERAARRYKQLKSKGLVVNEKSLFDDIVLRDARDMNRKIAPLKPADDAYVIDSTSMSIEEVFDYMLKIIDSNLHN